MKKQQQQVKRWNNGNTPPRPIYRKNGDSEFQRYKQSYRPEQKTERETIGFLDIYGPQLKDTQTIPTLIRIKYTSYWHFLNFVISFFIYLFIMFLWVCLRYKKGIIISLTFFTMIIQLPILLFLFINHIFKIL